MNFKDIVMVRLVEIGIMVDKLGLPKKEVERVVSIYPQDLRMLKIKETINDKFKDQSQRKEITQLCHLYFVNWGMLND